MDLKAKNKYTTFYVVRHGETTANVQGIIQGQKDYPLNSNGEEQAKARARQLKSVKFDAIFSSDLVRAKRTAEIISLESKMTVLTTKALRERCYGEYEDTVRKNWSEEINKVFDRWYLLADAQWMKHRVGKDFETGEEVITRFMRFVREMAVAYPSKTILAVCHGDLMRNFLVHLGFATKEQLRGTAIQNTGYFILETDGVDYFIKKTVGIVKTD